MRTEVEEESEEWKFKVESLDEKLSFQLDFQLFNISENLTEEVEFI